MHTHPDTVLKVRRLGVQQIHVGHNESICDAIQELDLASEDTKVYKLIGPTLIRQDLVEAKSNVNKRLDFIKGELSRLDTRLSDYQSKASKRQQQVTQILPSHALHADFHL